MVYTGLANLDLLTQVYPNPRFVFFGMLTLEGGVIYWVGAFLLNNNGVHKGISVIMIGIDAIFSLIGFFIDISNHNASQAFLSQLPSIPILLAIDVAFNVAVGWIIHLIPDTQKADLRPLVDTARNVVSHFQRNGAQERETTTRSR